ncbi:hypothetical protein J3R82DRAFT_3875 [Butyriboletus roseoflavus]|nr:hypothetical protein J3R82DRAFT_3875 [Butyriboletus roseoflavus]
MASPPPNPDTRELPYGWIQQYNWEFYVNTREQPPRSSWEHPLGPMTQGFAAPHGHPPDRSYNRSPYGAPPQGYGGSYGSQGYYNAPSGGYASGPPYGPPGYSQRYYPEERVTYVEQERKQKKGPGVGTALLAGGAGLVGGALLMDAFEDHNEYERDEGFQQGLITLNGYVVDDHRSICSADGQNARSPVTVSEVGAVTPAQAYASAVRTGETHDRALCYTIERKQLERKADPQLVPSYLGDPGSPRRGLSFAQRLYASALSDGSSTQPSSNITILPPIEHPSSSALSMRGGSQVPRKTSHSTALFDTSSEVSQSFHPSDLYHTSVATHGLPSWGSTSPEVSATRPPSLLPALQITKHLPAARLSYPANPLASCTPPENFSPRSGAQNPRPVLHQSRNISTEAQSYSTPALSIHEASDLQGFHPPVVAGGVIPSSSPLAQQLVNSPSSSPPPLEEHERLSNLFEEVVADDAPVVIQPPVAVPQGDGLPDSLLEPPPDVDLEDVPLYSLVDDQLPPPTFDDLQGTSTAEASAERSPVLHPQILPEELVEAPSSQSLPPSQLLPTLSHGSPAYAPGKASAYALLDQTSYPVGTRKGILQDAKIPPSSITSDSSLSDPPSAVPIDFKWSNQPPPPISPIPPPRAPHDGPSMTPLLPCSSRLPSVLFSHSPDSQFTSISYDPLAIRKSSPPLVNHRTKPTAEQSGQPLPLVPTSQAMRDPQPHISAAEDNDAIDTLTRSMSDMMGGLSSDAHSPAYENLSSGRPDILGISLGKKQNIPIIPASHPSGIPNSMGSLNQETYRPEAEWLIPETYQRPTHAETGGRVGYGIQGLGSANPPVAANILSAQHSPCTIPLPAPIPPACSHEELQTESSRTTRDGSNFSQFGETVALSTRRSYHSDQPHIASLLPSHSFPHSLQPSYHPIDRGTHGPVAPSGTIPLQQQNIHSLEILDPMKRGGHVLPPPPPPLIGLQPWNVPQMPHTSSHSQGGANDQFHLGNKGPTRSNDLPKEVAHDALLDPSGPPAYACYGSNQR